MFLEEFRKQRLVKETKNLEIKIFPLKENIDKGKKI